MSSTLPAPLIGYLFLAGSALLLALGAHALLFSALFPSRAPLGGTGGTLGEWQWQWKRPNIIIIDIMIAIMNAVLDALARDAHYKYLALFSVPVCAYFVIANWVGWQFFRNSWPQANPFINTSTYLILFLICLSGTSHRLIAFPIYPNLPIPLLSFPPKTRRKSVHADIVSLACQMSWRYLV
jgi:hypothetical protein